MARIVEARKAGATIQEMRQRFGISYALACEISRQYDAQPARGAARCVYPRLAEWMIRNRVSRKEFALRTGLSLKTLCNFLSGYTKNPADKNLLAIERVTRLSIAEIMETEEEDHAK